MEYIIKNNNNLSAKLIDFGATVVSLEVPDKNGNFSDVVLGYDSEEEYKDDPVYFGAIVGRFGNRIAGGKFKLEGKEYILATNNGENHLHGGIKGFNQVIWKGEQLSSHAVRLSYLSPDGEEGYPGNLKIEVTYSMTEDNSLKIDYSAVTDAVTILNPTNHCYFNLSGSTENSILDHQLFIDAAKYTPVNDNMIPVGEIADVKNTPMDFTELKPIGQDIGDKFDQLIIGSGYDHNWVLNNFSGQVRKIVTVYEPGSGRLMDVLSDQPGVQFYSGNFLDGIKGKKGQVYKKHQGFCLETQFFPDSPNKPGFPSVVLKPGEEYEQITLYRFSVK